MNKAPKSNNQSKIVFALCVIVVILSTVAAFQYSRLQNLQKNDSVSTVKEVTHGGDSIMTNTLLAGTGVSSDITVDGYTFVVSQDGVGKYKYTVTGKETSSCIRTMTRVLTPADTSTVDNRTTQTQLYAIAVIKLIDDSVICTKIDKDYVGQGSFEAKADESLPLEKNNILFQFYVLK